MLLVTQAVATSLYGAATVPSLVRYHKRLDKPLCSRKNIVTMRLADVLTCDCRVPRLSTAILPGDRQLLPAIISHDNRAPRVSCLRLPRARCTCTEYVSLRTIFYQQHLQQPTVPGSTCQACSIMRGCQRECIRARRQNHTCTITRAHAHVHNHT